MGQQHTRPGHLRQKGRVQAISIHRSSQILFVGNPLARGRAQSRAEVFFFRSVTFRRGEGAEEVFGEHTFASLHVTTHKKRKTRDEHSIS